VRSASAPRYSIWRHETDPMDPRTLENDKAVTDAVEAVWISENHLRIRLARTPRSAPRTPPWSKLSTAN
jgi:hypothetical protein